MNDASVNPASLTAFASRAVSRLMIGMFFFDTGISGVMMLVAFTGTTPKQV